jgi:acetyl-CoA synthetase
MPGFGQTTQPHVAADEYLWPLRRYTQMYQRSMQEPEKFWAEQAQNLEWFRTWDKVLDWQPPYARWFVGGQLNAAVQCLDRHARSWRKSKVAIYWEGENGDSRVLSYSTLFREVNHIASVLKKLGVNKGDKVVLYLPMIPELPAFMLACGRIGAIHTVIFSGFSPQAIAGRVNSIQARVIVTADGGYRRGKIIPLKELVDEAVALCPSIERIIAIKRTRQPVPWKAGRDLWLGDLMNGAEAYVAPEPVESTHPLYILYTSGTTGKPKGIVHSTGGYMVYNYASYQWVFNVREESVFWCTADVGWVTGHSSTVYGPLSHGAAIVIYEGAPDYPGIDRWWDIIEKYGVTAFYTSPTAVRMFMSWGEESIKNHDLSTLELLGSVGEPINPEAWHWFYSHVGNKQCPIVDTWWQTETGGMMISPTPGIESSPLKPGSASFPLPGIEPAVFDTNGNELSSNQTGHLVLKRPWPGMLMDVYGDSQRYDEAYWSRFPGVFYTGDYAMRDADGYFWLFGRADEVLKVTGHRLGTAEIESAVIDHPYVAESAVTSKPDPVKGDAIVLFVTLRQGIKPSMELKSELVAHVRQLIGPVATPSEIYFVNSLPKTRSGKIMRRVLKAVACGQNIGDITTLDDEASVAEAQQAYENLKQASEEDAGD